MVSQVKAEWNARFKMLSVLVTIIQTKHFDTKGLCTDNGEYKRCDLAQIYFDLRTDSGEGEPLWDDTEFYSVFLPSPLERASLDLMMASNIYYLSYKRTGQVFGREIDEEELAALRKRSHSDNPDDELLLTEADEAGKVNMNEGGRRE